MLKHLIKWEIVKTKYSISLGIFAGDEELSLEYLSPFLFGINVGQEVVTYVDDPEVPSDGIDDKLLEIFESIVKSDSYAEYLTHENKKVRDFTKILIDKREFDPEWSALQES